MTKDHKIIYIAHPISGDVDGNLQKIAAIYRELSMMPGIVPFVPYYAAVCSLDDSNENERACGISHNLAIFNSGIIDEVWLFGPNFSNGMRQEVILARSLKISVVNKSEHITLDAMPCH